MDHEYTDEQWKMAEAPARLAILDARGSSQVVTEMLRIWEKTRAWREKRQIGQMDSEQD